MKINTMTYRVLVDVNIFVDVICKRKGWEDSFKLLEIVKNGEADGWISSFTKPMLYFLHVSKIGEKSARKLVTDLTESFAEIPLRQGINSKALLGILPEYVDNIQLESAKQFLLDAIITGDKKKYCQDKLTTYTPEEFIALLSRKSDLTLPSIPFLDLSAQHHKIYNEIDDRITDIMTSNGFILGKHVEEFEKNFAELQGAKYCIGVSSGTDALHVALLALGIGCGDLVVLPVNTFIATAEAVSLCGAEPLFVDCDQYYNIDVKKLREKLGSMDNEQLVRLKAIIPVHLYGQPVNMTELMAIAGEFALNVVEDCCQSHLAQWQGRMVGTFGSFGAFSFYPGKNLGAAGEAGALVTNDEDLFLKSRKIRQHGEIKRYHHEVVGHNYRMAAIQGAVLASKLKYLEEWSRKRLENARLYSKLLGEMKSIRIPEELNGTSCVYHLYVIQCNDRDGLQRYLQEQGIATGIHYPIPLHMQQAYGYLGYRSGDFPVAEQAAERMVSLPMYPQLNEDQIRYVCNQVRQFVTEH